MSAQQCDLDIMAILKAGTSEQHRAMEQQMPFFHEGFTLRLYQETLARWIGFLAPVERKLSSLSGWSSMGLDLADRQRTNLLRHDLRALGMTASQMETLPVCDKLPRIESICEGLGCLYVFEGSTLGGQLIARELLRRFGIDQSSGAAFFHGHGADTGAMWRAFCDNLRKAIHLPVEQDQVLRAAKDTFTTFGNWM